MILSAAAAALVIIATCGLAFAYFSDYDAARGEGVLTLGGSTHIEEEWDDYQKIVEIKNTGQTRVIVRVAIYGPAGIDITDDEKNWIHPEGSDYYYYKYILEPGNTENAVTTTLTVNTEPLKDKDLGDTYDIEVKQYCAQVTYKADGSIFPPEGWDAAAVAQITERKGE